MGMRTVCRTCHGEGRILWQDIEPIEVMNKGLSCEPPHINRHRIICSRCGGMGYTHEPEACGS